MSEISGSVHVDSVCKRYPGEQGPVDALRGVSLETVAGELIAIVGPNGAGKSTLLQIISGVLAPSSGTVARPKSIAALLEVGSSFHPDLTGRENLEVGLGLARLTRSVRRDALEEIASFAEVTSSLDVPVKHYSSGMVARLSCALAVHGASELLIVDEALAVGDASFQRKLLRRVEEMRSDGATVLMTTHSVALARFAPRCVWLRDGHIIRDGASRAVLEEYEATAGSGRMFAEHPSGQFIGLTVAPAEVGPGDSLEVEVRVETFRPVEDLAVRIETRPVVGDEPWMRRLEDEPWMRDLRLVAATRPHRLGPLDRGCMSIRGRIGGVPITPTELDVTVVLIDGSGLIQDEIVGHLVIRGPAGRPSFLLRVDLADR